MRHLRHTIILAAALIMSLLGVAAAAPAAFAIRVMSPQDGTGTPTPVASAVHNGMPSWEIALIAVGAIFALVAVTVVLLRKRTRRTLQPSVR